VTDRAPGRAEPAEHVLGELGHRHLAVPGDGAPGADPGGVDEHEPVDELGMVGREVDRDPAAVGVADDAGA
jgi:hypothetical protein